MQNFQDLFSPNGMTVRIWLGCGVCLCLLGFGRFCTLEVPYYGLICWVSGENIVIPINLCYGEC